MQVEYRNVDAKLVVNEIRNGRSLESCQKMFGLRFKSEVQDLYLRGLMELGEIPAVDFSKREPAAARAPREPAPAERPAPRPAHAERQAEAPRPVLVRRRERPAPAPVSGLVITTKNLRTIGQSGSITLNKALLIEQLGFAVGDAFEISREDDRVVLKKTGQGR